MARDGGQIDAKHAAAVGEIFVNERGVMFADDRVADAEAQSLSFLRLVRIVGFRDNGDAGLGGALDEFNDNSAGGAAVGGGTAGPLMVAARGRGEGGGGKRPGWGRLSLWGLSGGGPGSLWLWPKIARGGGGV